MLKSWSIENFKAIINSGDLKLAPITILAGKNSSGKSSLLQSILMIAQTLSSRVLDRPLLPSGAIIQLGTFDNILNESSNISNLTIHFELEIENEPPVGSLRRSSFATRVYYPRPNIKSIEITVCFCKLGNNRSNSSAIEASLIGVENVLLKIEALNSIRPHLEDVEAGEYTFDLNIKKANENDISAFLMNVTQEFLRLVPYSGDQSNYLGQFHAKDTKLEKRLPQMCLVNLSHFLPARLVQKFELEARRRQHLARAIQYLFDYPSDSPLPRPFSEALDIEAPISEDLKKTIQNIFVDKNITEQFSGQSLHEIAHWLKNLRMEVRGEKRKVPNNKVKEVKEIIGQAYDVPKTDFGINRRSEGLETIVNNIFIEHLEQAVEQTSQFFTSKIRYLGPLRADPQASQKFAPSSELDDVGSKGEYAAAVYDANQNAPIEWYNPYSKKTEIHTLKVALDSWARYLGVANQIKIEMAGQSGVSWQVVHLEGHKPLPLSAVGVGVSQVLPILVMGLLAPKNTMLIVEQPELHLHPKVQARLGDFFVGISKCHKQCIIETHSENIVSQLRYHIVEAGGQDKSDCIIYFVDQDDKGAARFEPIEISPNGNILNWPDGFFDETMHQENRINAASIKRRARLKKNG